MPVRMTIIRKTKIISAGEVVEKRELICTVGENINWCGHYKKSLEGPQKIKNRIILWSSNSTSGHISKGIYPKWDLKEIWEIFVSSCLF